MIVYSKFLIAVFILTKIGFWSILFSKFWKCACTASQKQYYYKLNFVWRGYIIMLGWWEWFLVYMYVTYKLWQKICRISDSTMLICILVKKQKQKLLWFGTNKCLFIYKKNGVKGYFLLYIMWHVKRNCKCVR